MRKFIPVLLAAVIILSCKGKTNTTVITSDDGKTKVAIAVDQAVSVSEALGDKAAELKKLTPLSTDQLKDLLPAEILGMKKSSFNANSMMGFSVADAKYKGDDGKEIEISIFDCAGEAGAGIYSLNYYTKMSIESESEDGYTHTIDFNGGKAIEVYEKNNDKYNLSYFTADRLLVNISGEKTGVDAVKGIAKDLRLKVE